MISRASVDQTSFTYSAISDPPWSVGLRQHRADYHRSDPL